MSVRVSLANIRDKAPPETGFDLLRIRYTDPVGRAKRA
jgi:hypothetical protein